MKANKIFSFILITTISLYAQYFGERSTEQNFEQSELYFTSHYLNPFGLLNFKNIAAGFFDDPFLNLCLNPALSPDFEDQSTVIYLDLRGDRTKVKIRDDYVVPLYTTQTFFYYPFDWRWFAVTRSEPEPIFSFGIISQPLISATRNFYIGATYQLINKQEKFYSIPYGIYYPQYYYDNFGIRLQGLESIPMVDHYYGDDDLSTVGRIFSAFSGYRINDQWSVGLSCNLVVHSRDGGYLNNYQDNQFNQGDYRQSSLNSQYRQQDYKHIDLSAGAMYKLTEKFF